MCCRFCYLLCLFLKLTTIRFAARSFLLNVACPVTRISFLIVIFTYFDFNTFWKGKLAKLANINNKLFMSTYMIIIWNAICSELFLFNVHFPINNGRKKSFLFSLKCVNCLDININFLNKTWSIITFCTILEYCGTSKKEI